MRIRKKASQTKKNIMKRRVKKVPLPEIRKQFTRECLPELPLKMYLRLSQIYGIPLKDLLPYRGKNTNPLYVRAQYNRFKHEIMLFPTFASRIRKIFKRSTTEHVPEGIATEELLHSLQALLQRTRDLLLKHRIEKYKEKAGKTRKKRKRIKRLKRKVLSLHRLKKEEALGIEPSAQVHKKPNILRDMLDSFRYADTLTNVWPGYIARMKVKEYFERYGADGLLLLYADPPENWNLTNLEEKERFFLEKGLLEKGKGLTKKGIRYMREKVPREIILRALQIMRKAREKKRK